MHICLFPKTPFLLLLGLHIPSGLRIQKSPKGFLSSSQEPQSEANLIRSLTYILAAADTQLTRKIEILYMNNSSQMLWFGCMEKLPLLLCPEASTASHYNVVLFPPPPPPPIHALKR